MAIKFICENCGSETVIDEIDGFVATCCDNNTLKTVNLRPQVIKNNNAGDKKMNKSDVRIKKLEAAGFDVSKFENLFGSSNLDALLNSCMNDPVAEEISKTDIKNPHLFRRWVMAQTFRLLGDDMDWTKRFQARYRIKYQWDMLTREFEALDAIKRSRDTEALEERLMFFNKKVLIDCFTEYNRMLYKKYLTNSKKARECNGIKRKFYELQATRHTECIEVVNKIISTIQIINEHNFIGLANYIRSFASSAEFKHIPSYKCTYSFIDSYKGAGAYYTLQNMFRFHGVYGLSDSGNLLLSKEMSLDNLHDRAVKYKDSYYKLLAYLKEVIKESNFSWKKRMEEVYSK